MESKIYKAPLVTNLELDSPDFVPPVPQEVVTLDLKTPQALVLDWIGRLLYWADSGKGCVEVMDLQNGTRRVLLRELAQVTSLALDVATR